MTNTKFANERHTFTSINSISKIKLYDMIMCEADDTTLRKICKIISKNI